MLFQTTGLTLSSVQNYIFGPEYDLLVSTGRQDAALPSFLGLEKSSLCICIDCIVWIYRASQMRATRLPSYGPSVWRGRPEVTRPPSRALNTSTSPKTHLLPETFVWELRRR